ncbi:MAG TPA: hypothetical protein VG737_08055, partial [Cyclobacteriaceae bacterium]|nr:hypothetical protein [Cyclobacteriaceae bacterium]
GVLLGFMPFAKLQGTPVALLMGLIAVIFLFIKRGPKSALTLTGISLLPSAVILGSVLLYGGFQDFLRSYVFSNFGYMTAVSTKSVKEYYDLFIQIIYTRQELAFLFTYALSTASVGLVMMIILIRHVPVESLALAAFSILLLVTSAVCVVMPGRNFGHYLLLFVFPAVIAMACIGWACVQAIRDGEPGDHSHLMPYLKGLLAFVFIAAPCYYFITLFSYHPDFTERAKARYDEYIPARNKAIILNRYFTPGRKMAVWGWGTELWSSTDYLMGTRDGTCFFQLTPGKNQDFYLQRYIGDLERNKTEVFIDAVAPGFAFYEDRSVWGFEQYPLVRNYILRNYELEAEVDEARIYLRKGSKRPDMKFVADIEGAKAPAINDFHCTIENIQRNGSFLQFQGWTVLTNNTDHQHVDLAFITQTDTLLLKTYQTAKRSVVEFSPNNKDNLWCGFLGLIPWKDLPKGTYEIGLRVTNEGLVGFKKLNQSFVID